MFRRMVSRAGWLVALVMVSYHVGYKRWRRRWEASADESARALPGDELVPDPQFRQTMAVTIEAPSSAVWPWLVQMGYGRAGWYSYDTIDMLGQSSRDIRPELQDLQLGQPIPLGPGLDFRVEMLEKDRALVLYGDSATIEQQHAALTGERAPRDNGETAGLRLVGALSAANSSAFRVSWAFILEPLDAGHTRLLERFRTWTTPGPAAAVVGPIVDVGHFLMTRRQMLGIKERAEASAAAPRAVEPPETGPREVETRAVAAAV
jgi:hypothetical protein